jgi:hypothetical protein
LRKSNLEGHYVIPANPGSDPVQAPESSSAAGGIKGILDSRFRWSDGLMNFPH